LTHQQEYTGLLAAQANYWLFTGCKHLTWTQSLSSLSKKTDLEKLLAKLQVEHASVAVLEMIHAAGASSVLHAFAAEVRVCAPVIEGQEKLMVYIIKLY
jgi:hypothetical protein